MNLLAASPGPPAAVDLQVFPSHPVPVPTLGPRRHHVGDLASGHPLKAATGLGTLGVGVRVDVPFYTQSLDFSCGPACLLMAMAAHEPGTVLDRGHEIDVWREANLVEIGATSRYGLALAAHRRGFRPRIVGSCDRMAYKTQILARISVDEDLLDLFFDDARAKSRAASIPEEIRPVTMADIEAALLAEEVPIVLTDTRMFTPEEEVPHWVVVTGMVDDTVYLHNPLDAEHARDQALPLERFLAGFGYGGDQLMVAVGARVNG